jgi:hypothetical protein
MVSALSVSEQEVEPNEFEKGHSLFRVKGMECLGILHGMCVPVGRGVGKLIGEKLVLENGTG